MSRYLIGASLQARPKGAAMPMFETTHVVELTITHRVEAATAEEAHGIISDSWSAQA